MSVDYDKANDNVLIYISWRGDKWDPLMIGLPNVTLQLVGDTSGRQYPHQYVVFGLSLTKKWVFLR